ncbi:hypothetical protein [Rhodococcus sp. BP22]|uniref:hypothetical protein n=1 Tax=Rhodococcus sp. BP22 TaxID=2758566 RepID=UPI001648816F|nr:hypothetical protein [Rhodococcus sp. BP22]
MTAPDDRRWVMDTSTFTHFCRSGHEDILRRLAPQGLVLIPDTVNTEIEAGIEAGYDITSPSTLDWVEIGVLTADEARSQQFIKVDMPSGKKDPPEKNLGECAVLACAKHRGMIAVIDDGDARAQARARELPSIGTMWIICEAHKHLDDIDAEQVYQALLDTDMHLPQANSFVEWAKKFGLLPIA